MEGAILRGGYLSDTELTDGFPSNPGAYFRRLHRWVRGDWQNISFIFKRGRCLAFADRWKLSTACAAVFSRPSALRRSSGRRYRPLLPRSARVLPLQLRSARGCCPRPGPRSSGVTGSGSAPTRPTVSQAGLCRSCCVLRFCPGRPLSALTPSGLRFGAWSFPSATFSPGRPQPRARAGHGKLLEPWPLALSGLALLVFSPAPGGRVLGVFWLAAAFAAPRLGRPVKSAPPLPEADRRFLLGEASKIWAYFAAFCTPEDNFLPPDNWQEQPPTGLAHRTSPTNIGLALVSALAAADLGLCSAPEASGAHRAHPQHLRKADQMARPPL